MNIDYSTFDSFVNSTSGQSIGAGECWDYINLLWAHLGSRYYTYDPADPSGTNHGVKWGWLNSNARAANTITDISQITSISSVKRGDIVVTSGGEYGHAGFAETDYDGSGYLLIYSQNFDNKRYVSIDRANMETFVGAFRNSKWNDQPEPPTPTKLTIKKFNWVLYANKLRNTKL